MAGITSIKVQESLDELTQLLCQVNSSSAKERLQVLYWLKQEDAPSVSAIAKAIGKHRNTLQTWLSIYREGGVKAMLEIKKSPGGVRGIPQWGATFQGENSPWKLASEDALAKRLQDPYHGFQSYGEVQQWLAETLGVEAKYHAVYQMTHYRLKAKLKVARPRHYKQDNEQPEVFKKNLLTISTCWVNTTVKSVRMSDRYVISLKMRAVLDWRPSSDG